MTIEPHLYFTSVAAIRAFEQQRKLIVDSQKRANFASYVTSQESRHLQTLNYKSTISVIMSFPNFGEGGAQPQQGAEEQGGYGAPQQQHQMGQQIDPNQQQNQYPGVPQPGPGGPGSQSGGDQKTTLWYVVKGFDCQHMR